MDYKTFDKCCRFLPPTGISSENLPGKTRRKKVSFVIGQLCVSSSTRVEGEREKKRNSVPECLVKAFFLQHQQQHFSLLSFSDLPATALLRDQQTGRHTKVLSFNHSRFSPPSKTNLADQPTSLCPTTCPPLHPSHREENHQFSSLST